MTANTSPAARTIIGLEDEDDFPRYLVVQAQVTGTEDLTYAETDEQDAANTLAYLLNHNPATPAGRFYYVVAKQDV